ncbi:MAG TPA: potassium-transporting ATPase subunit C [Mycobacterium sp.]|nr:potassium-transporting ATPase subunit C [Mycobacterium sp.]
MKLSNVIRQHWAAFRALLALTVITGLVYPVAIWLISLLPILHRNADGSIVDVGDKAVGSKLIGQSFTDAAGNALPQYFQSRPSAAGAGYDPLSTGASNLGPESIVDIPGKPSLLTQVCMRSAAIGKLEHVDGSRPFCTGNGVGAVLSVIGPRDANGNVVHPLRVVSVNEPCSTTRRPFIDAYEGVRVECALEGQDYSVGQIVPVRGAAPADPVVPADAVTASGSGLDPDISPAYAQIQVGRVAKARHVSEDQIRRLVNANEHGRTLGFLGEPGVDVLALNIALDQRYPVAG